MQKQDKGIKLDGKDIISALLGDYSGITKDIPVVKDITKFLNTDEVSDVTSAISTAKNLQNIIPDYLLQQAQKGLTPGSSGNSILDSLLKDIVPQGMFQSNKKDDTLSEIFGLLRQGRRTSR